MTIKDVIPENKLSEEVKNELNNIKEMEKTVDSEISVYRANKYTYEYNFPTKNTFGGEIYKSKITLKEADEDHSSLLLGIINFDSKIKPKNAEKKKQRKEDVLENLYALFEGRERVLHAFDNKIFPIKTEGEGFSDRTGDKVYDH